MIQMDVLISGAGIAGGALALALARAAGSGLRVGLVERGGGTAVPEFLQQDARALAISPVSSAMLAELDVWQRLSANDCGRFTDMHVWEQSGKIHFRAHELGQTFMGHIVPLPALLAAVHAQLAVTPGIQMFRPAQVTALTRNKNAVALTLDNGQQISAALWVGADGARSATRTLAGIAVRETDYHHSTVTALARTEHSHQHTAWQRFLPQGPLGFLPLADEHEVSVVWSVEPEFTAELMAMNEQEFCATVSAASQGALGQLRNAGPRRAYPLFRRHAVHYTQAGVALVADAAHTVHPLAGQGINLGLLDVAVLTEELLRAQRRGRPLGALAVLQRYEVRRRAHNLLMQDIMGSFRYLFGTQNIPLRWARNLTMNVADALPLFKRFFVHTASGFQGEVPQLALPSPRLITPKVRTLR